MFFLNLLIICAVFKSVIPQNCTTENLGDIWISNNGGVRACVLDEENNPDSRRACWNNWGMNESIVACRSLDYPGVVSNGRAANMERLGIRFTCEATELNLSECEYNRSLVLCQRLLGLECQDCSETHPCPNTGYCNSDNKCECINECQNGGYCLAGTCICPDEFNGDTCESCPECLDTNKGNTTTPKKSSNSATSPTKAVPSDTGAVAASPIITQHLQLLS